jgi:hypothetical protein
MQWGQAISATLSRTYAIGSWAITLPKVVLILDVDVISKKDAASGFAIHKHMGHTGYRQSWLPGSVVRFDAFDVRSARTFVIFWFARLNVAK